MIEILEGFPDNVTAFAIHGHVTNSDDDTVLIPDFEMRPSRHKKVRIYCEIVTDITGFDPAAIWKDTKLGFGHFFDSERRAVVSDVEWVHHVTKLSEFLRFLWPGEYRSFSESESTKAREWISQPQQ